MEPTQQYSGTLTQDLTSAVQRVEQKYVSKSQYDALLGWAKEADAAIWIMVALTGREDAGDLYRKLHAQLDALKAVQQ